MLGAFEAFLWGSQLHASWRRASPPAGLALSRGCAICVSLQKIRTVELEGKTIKLQIVRAQPPCCTLPVALRG